MQLDTNLLQHGTINNVSPCCTLAHPASAVCVVGLLLYHIALHHSSLLAMPRLQAQKDAVQQSRLQLSTSLTKSLAAVF
jgi:hypothetical protein